MKKTFLKSALMAVAGVGLMAGNAMALLTLDSSFAQNSSDYWTLTDLNTSIDGNSNFQITLEDASYESSFGLYSVNDITNPNPTLTNRVKVFTKTDEPFYSSKTVTFRNDEGGTYSVTLDGTNFTAFDDMFGFYFWVFTGGASDTTLGYLWYTDQRLNYLADATTSTGCWS